MKRAVIVVFVPKISLHRRILDRRAFDDPRVYLSPDRYLRLLRRHLDFCYDDPQSHRNYCFLNCLVVEESKRESIE